MQCRIEGNVGGELFGSDQPTFQFNMVVFHSAANILHNLIKFSDFLPTFISMSSEVTGVDGVDGFAEAGVVASGIFPICLMIISRMTPSAAWFLACNLEGPTTWKHNLNHHQIIRGWIHCSAEKESDYHRTCGSQIPLRLIRPEVIFMDTFRFAQ